MRGFETCDSTCCLALARAGLIFACSKKAGFRFILSPICENMSKTNDDENGVSHGQARVKGFGALSPHFFNVQTSHAKAPFLKICVERRRGFVRFHENSHFASYSRQFHKTSSTMALTQKWCFTRTGPRETHFSKVMVHKLILQTSHAKTSFLSICVERCGGFLGF